MVSARARGYRVWKTTREKLPGLLTLLSVLMVQVADPAAVQGLRHRLFDGYQRLYPRPAQLVPLRVVDIDDASLMRHGQWPWPRLQMARLLEKLGQAGAAVIVLDMVFSEADRFSGDALRALLPASPLASDLPDFDRELAVVIQRYPVVGGVALGREAGRNAPEVKASFALLGPNPLNHVPVFSGALVNIPQLAAAFSGVGSFSVDLGQDAVVRMLPLLQGYHQQLIPALVLEALRVAQGVGTIAVRSGGEQDTPAGVQRIRVGALDVPVAADGRIWLHYAAPLPDMTVPAFQVLEDTSGLEALFSGHIVLVGSSASALGDFVATPRAVSTPALQVHAQAIAQLLQGWYLQRPTWGQGAEWLALLAASLLLVMFVSRIGVAWCGLLVATTIAGAAAVAWYAFTRHLLLLDPLVPAFGLLLVYLASALSVFVRAERDRLRIRRAFGQYLSPDLVDQLAEDPDRLRLGGETRELSFLFSDIEGFTALTEKIAAEDLVRLLNAYLDGACRVVMAHGGTIDKIVGDAIHAIFGAPLPQSDHAQRAVRCALALDEFGRHFSRDRAQEGIRFGITRIGVNTGLAVVGNFGGERRFDYTAHGDAINTAARLESANKVLGTRICVARSSVEQCAGVSFRPVGGLGLRGKSETVEVFEPVSDNAQGLAPTPEYLRAFAAMRSSRRQARKLMAALATGYPDDALVALHAARLARDESGDRIDIA